MINAHEMSWLIVAKHANAEIEKWLDFKKVSAKKRIAYADNIATLAEAISEGSLSLNDETFVLTQNLKFPIGEQLSIPQFTFKPRVAVGDLNNAMNGVKATDAEGRINAYISALTNQSKEVIKKLDTEDFTIPQAIAVFFI